jgi:transcriptional regulator GlxA family with amidase domain
MARIVLAAYDGAQGLDVMGPAEVFACAGRHLGRPAYDVVLADVSGHGVRVTSGLTIATTDLTTLRPRRTDTVLVVGGEEGAVRTAMGSKALVAWLARAAPVVRRIGSVCTGTFVLAHAGVLDGKRVATHWSACARLVAFRPQVTVDPNAIFVQEGRIWTSAGVTTGIDMALAMVEEDHGSALADAVAARLVLYVRRPGFQSQFSDTLVAQRDASEPLAPVLSWARSNLAGGLSGARLARRAGMSLRSFHRRCVEQFRTTPAKLIEGLRVEHARTLLATTALGTKAVAVRAGFVSPGRMARVFQRTLGIAPSDYAALHRRPAATGARKRSR